MSTSHDAETRGTRSDEAQTHVRTFSRTTMKSGLPSLKTTLAWAWTQIHTPGLDSSLKTVRPLSPVLITGQRGESRTLEGERSQDRFSKWGKHYFFSGLGSGGVQGLSR